MSIIDSTSDCTSTASSSHSGAAWMRSFAKGSLSALNRLFNFLGILHFFYEFWERNCPLHFITLHFCLTRKQMTSIGSHRHDRNWSLQFTENQNRFALILSFTFLISINFNETFDPREHPHLHISKLTTFFYENNKFHRYLWEMPREMQFYTLLIISYDLQKK